jgi:hypothetical protein
LSTRKDFSSEYLTFVKNLGTKLAVAGLLLSAVLFVVWMLKEGLLLHPVVLATIVSVVILLLAAKSNKNSYVTTAILVVVALFISGVRELIRYNIMSGLGYDLYGYPMNLEWETIIMFLLTFVILGFTGVAFILTMAWKVGKREGVFDASKDVVVTRLGNATLTLFIIWTMVYFGWGIFALFKNTL